MNALLRVLKLRDDLSNIICTTLSCLLSIKIPCVSRKEIMEGEDSARNVCRVRQAREISASAVRSETNHLCALVPHHR